MFKSELIRKSALGILNRSTNGGLTSGKMGVFLSRHGVGKTACLIHVAIDQMLKNKGVMHLSFSDDTTHIDRWYQNIYQEMVKVYNLENAKQIYDNMISNRVMIRFGKNKSSFSHIEKSIEILADSTHFNTSMLLVDGIDTSNLSKKELESFRKFAIDKNISIWFACTVPEKEVTFDKNGIPESFSEFNDLFSVIVFLETERVHVRLKLIKDYDIFPVPDIHLELDPGSMMIKES